MVFKSFIEIDGKKILHELFEKYKNEDWVLSSDEIERKQYSIFPGKWGNKVLMKYKIKFGLISGLLWLTPPTSIDIDVLLGWVHSRKKLIFIHLDSIHDVNKELKITSSTNIILRDLKYVSDLNVKSEEIKITMSEPEVQFLQKFIDKFTLEVDNKFESERIKEKIERKNRIEKEKKQVESFKKSQSNYLREFDKDNNGIVDDIEGTDELMKLLRKHQKKIIEVDKNYIQNLIKVSNYLKIKRENIQTIFNELKKTKSQSELNNYVGILKNKIHVYQYLIFHSLNMISSILNEDLITFYEIYESFDKLKIFNSTWENEVSGKLTNIGDGLSELMFSINKMEQNIVSEIGNLTYVTQESMRDLGNTVSKELDSVNSSIKFNNLLTGISTYQLYQINKSTKSLRG